MLYVAWDARLSKLDDKGVSARASLQRTARKQINDKFKQIAIRELENGPPFPLELEYLHAWFQDIRRGLGVGMEGLNALTWSALESWARLTGNRPAPHEVDALIQLDIVARNPKAFEDAQRAPQGDG